MVTDSALNQEARAFRPSQSVITDESLARPRGASIVDKSGICDGKVTANLWCETK